MCGLIGGSGKIESRYLVALGCLSESRGRDSAGIAWEMAGTMNTCKIAQNPLVAFPVVLSAGIRAAAKSGNPLIGHTRQATTGAVTSKNAHPFYDPESKIAWAHNGMIFNHATFGTFEVDSECLIAGIKKQDFTAFNGPIALLWLEGGKLHAFRKGNPLYRGIKRKAVYLASEKGMLEEIDCQKIKELSEGHIYVWNGMNIESSKSVPCNKTYYKRSTAITPAIACGEDDYAKRWLNHGRWDQGAQKWIHAEEELEPDLPSSQDPIELELDKLCIECVEHPKMLTRDHCQRCYDRAFTAEWLRRGDQ